MSDNDQNRYLCFMLGKEEYAIPLLTVREVIAVPEITPVPQTPSHFVGIMNLRGQVISVLDLRSKLGIKPNASADTAVIICDLHPNSLGVIVDKVESVLNPDPTHLSPRPQMENSKANDYVTGIYRKEERLILLIDIAKALGATDLGLAARTSGEQKKAA